MLKENINTKLYSENEDKDIFNSMRCENIHCHQTCPTEMLKEGFQVEGNEDRWKLGYKQRRGTGNGIYGVKHYFLKILLKSHLKQN